MRCISFIFTEWNLYRIGCIGTQRACLCCIIIGQMREIFISNCYFSRIPAPIDDFAKCIHIAHTILSNKGERGGGGWKVWRAIKAFIESILYCYPYLEHVLHMGWIWFCRMLYILPVAQCTRIWDELNIYKI